MSQIMTTPTTQRSLKLFPLIGFIQGILIWVFYKYFNTADSRVLLTHTIPLFFLIATSFLPILWFLTAQTNISSKKRAIGILLIILIIEIFALPLSSSNNTYFESNPAGSVFICLFAIISIHLLIGWRTDGKPGWNYQRLFHFTWRNTLLTITSILLTSICFGVLFAGAVLLEVIGINGVRDLLETKLVTSSLIGTFFASAFALGLIREDMLINMRRFILSITSWPLIILQVFAIFWVVALCFTDTQSIFESFSATSILLGFAFLSITFANSAYQDSKIIMPFGKSLSRLVQITWPFLIAIVGFASWALWLRVAQYGWTVSRIHAAIACFIAIVYVIGYSLSVIKNTELWMHSISKTNITASMTIMLCCIFLMNPWLTTTQIAINSQLSRLNHGLVSPNDFDFDLLTENNYGLAQLKELSAKKHTTQDQEIATLAEKSLNNMPIRSSAKIQQPITEKMLREQIKVLPSTAHIDPSFLVFINNAKDTALSACMIKTKYHCAIWINDFNNDSKSDVMMLQNNNTSRAGSVYSQNHNGWQSKDVIQISRDDRFYMDSTDIIKSIEENEAKTVRPIWNDIEINDLRFKIN